jgi:hypothetical protein
MLLAPQCDFASQCLTTVHQLKPIGEFHTVFIQRLNDQLLFFPASDPLCLNLANTDYAGLAEAKFFYNRTVEADKQCTGGLRDL